MCSMDQGDAVLWAAALGIGGTLLAALGSTIIQGRFARRQITDQEHAEVRRQLRDERRIAYISILDRCNKIEDALAPIIAARVRPDWSDDADHRELWTSTNAELRELKRSVATVAITGPRSMHELAIAIYDTMHARADSMRKPGLDFEERVKLYARAGAEFDSAHSRFIEAANALLATSGH